MNCRNNFAGGSNVGLYVDIDACTTAFAEIQMLLKFMWNTFKIAGVRF